MKTTLFTFLLFLSINLMGQTDSTSEFKLDTTLMVIYDDYYNDDIYVEFNFKDYVDAKIDKRIIELWKEYQVECWNDSTLLWYGSTTAGLNYYVVGTIGGATWQVRTVYY